MNYYFPACVSASVNGCEVRFVRQQGRNLPVLAASPHTCPAELDRLSLALVRDLPSYVNRAIQQSRKRTDLLYSSMLTASVPDFRPLENFSREYPVRFPQGGASQVFITTLERQYTGLRSSQLQQFHWLFLAKTNRGWRLSNIYTRTGGAPQAGTPISPPLESSRSIVGEAVRVWLNDCHLGRVRNNP